MLAGCYRSRSVKVNIESLWRETQKALFRGNNSEKRFYYSTPAYLFPLYPRRFFSLFILTIFVVFASSLLVGCGLQVRSTCNGMCNTTGNVQQPEGEVKQYEFNPNVMDILPTCPAIDLIHKKQETSSWCWASSTQSVMNYINKIASIPGVFAQCDLAETQFEREVAEARATTGLNDISCCKAMDQYLPSNPDENPDVAINSRIVCQEGAWPDEVLTKFNYRFDPPRLYPPDDGGLGWDELEKEICHSRPIIFVIRWQYDGRADGYHTGVVSGYRQLTDGSQWVEYHDAGADGFVVMSYEKWFLGSANDFSHEVDYINLRY